MRQVGTIADETSARRLADYLLTRAITTRVDPSPAGWVVWVHREEKWDEARREWAEFVANPDDPKYRSAGPAAEAARRDLARKEREHARKTVDLRGRLNVPSARRCPVTYTLMALSIAVAVLTQFGGDMRANRLFLLSPPIEAEESRTIELGPGGKGTITLPVATYRSGGLEAVRRGQVWRLVSPILLHYGVPHLVFNLIWLYQLGVLIEMRKGRVFLLGLILLAAVVSNLGEYLWQFRVRSPVEEAPLILFGGMSGVVYALFGYCWMASDHDPDAGIAIRSGTVVWMIGWLVLCMTGQMGPIANAAHVVGLGVGMVVGLGPPLIRGLR